MPRIKSAKKRVQTSERNRLRNLAIRTGYRTALRAVRDAADAGDIGLATTKLNEAFSKVDKAVKSKVIHKNTGARLKSRLSAKIKKATV